MCGTATGANSCTLRQVVKEISAVICHNVNETAPQRGSTHAVPDGCSTPEDLLELIFFFSAVRKSKDATHKTHFIVSCMWPTIWMKMLHIMAASVSRDSYHECDYAVKVGAGFSHLCRFMNPSSQADLSSGQRERKPFNVTGMSQLKWWDVHVFSST